MGDVAAGVEREIVVFYSVLTVKFVLGGVGVCAKGVERTLHIIWAGICHGGTSLKTVKLNANAREVGRVALAVCE